MLQVSNLTKRFNNFQALKEVSFEIKEGEKFGLLGPNGAGKTTLINILCGILKQDEGQIHINGINQTTHLSQLKKTIGSVPQEIALYDDFTAFQNLQFWGKLYGLKGKELTERIEEVLQFIDLYERKNEKIKNYSGGMKRRINIAAAILHEPDIIFFDEPTVGVDPQSRNKIFELIESLNDHGSTIIYTTHYMEEVERLCDRIAIIDNGSIIAQGSQEELKNLSQAQDKVLITIAQISSQELSQFTKQVDLPVQLKDKVLTISGNIQENLPAILNIISSLKLKIQKMETKPVNLEEIFLKLTGKKLRD